MAGVTLGREVVYIDLAKLGNHGSMVIRFEGGRLRIDARGVRCTDDPWVEAIEDATPGQ